MKPANASDLQYNNLKKTQVFHNEDLAELQSLMSIGSEVIENVRTFTYLGQKITTVYHRAAYHSCYCKVQRVESCVVRHEREHPNKTETARSMCSIAVDLWGTSVVPKGDRNEATGRMLA